MCLFTRLVVRYGLRRPGRPRPGGRAMLAKNLAELCSAGRVRHPPLRVSCHSLIRNHSFYFGRVGIAYQIAATQLAFALLVFRGQDVAQKRMSALHFSGRSFLEALSSAFVSF